MQTIFVVLTNYTLDGESPDSFRPTPINLKDGPYIEGHTASIHDTLEGAKAEVEEFLDGMYGTKADWVQQGPFYMDKSDPAVVYHQAVNDQFNVCILERTLNLWVIGEK